MDMDCRGWLFKRGHYRQSWKKRYFVVDPIKHTLCYYQATPPPEGSKARPPKALGIIDLTSSKVIVEKDLGHIQNCFRVCTPQRDFYIAATDPFKMNTWISVLRLNSKLGDLEKSLENKMSDANTTSKAKKEAEIGEEDEKYSLSFKLAADEMLKKLSHTAQTSRMSLEETSTRKYTIKSELKKYLGAIKAQRAETEDSLLDLRRQETTAHQELDSINVRIVQLDKYLQASRYLQRQTITLLSLNQSIPTFIRTLKEMIAARKTRDLPPELSRMYLALLTQNFPDRKIRMAGEASNTDFLQILHFYSQYYDRVHLPKELEMEPAKKRRLLIWKMLVASVNGMKKLNQQMSELTIIESQINQAITPGIGNRARPMSMTDPDDPDTQILFTGGNKTALKPIGEDRPGSISIEDETNGILLYRKEWLNIKQVIDHLFKLREREKIQSQQLDDALHSRELLASFSKKTSSVSTPPTPGSILTPGSTGGSDSPPDPEAKSQLQGAP